MIVSRIRDYLRQRGRASVDEIALHFDSDKSAVEGVMETLARRGAVLQLGCGGCASSGGCSFSGPKVYLSLEGGEAASPSGNGDGAANIASNGGVCPSS